MARRGWTPEQWRRLLRSERIEILAYEWQRDERRARLLAQLDEWTSETGALARLMVMLHGDA